MEDFVVYLEEIVEPTVQEFEAHPASKRHAFLACVAVFHAIDYRAYPKKAASVIEEYRGASADFLLVDRVAHAFKHVVGRRASTSLNVKDVISRPPAYWGVAAWGLSRWNDPVGGVTLDDDHSVDLLAVVKRAVEFLRQQSKSS
jgi:hypothetical protein